MILTVKFDTSNGLWLNPVEGSPLSFSALLQIARTNLRQLPPMDSDLYKILAEVVYEEWSCYDDDDRDPKYTHESCTIDFNGTIDEKVAALLRSNGFRVRARTYPVTFGQHYTDGILIPEVTRDVTKTTIGWYYRFPNTPPSDPNRIMPYSDVRFS